MFVVLYQNHLSSYLESLSRITFEGLWGAGDHIQVPKASERTCTFAFAYVRHYVPTYYTEGEGVTICEALTRWIILASPRSTPHPTGWGGHHQVNLYNGVGGEGTTDTRTCICICIYICICTIRKLFVYIYAYCRYIY